MTYEEKRKIEEILKNLNINPKINFPYYLNCVDNTNDLVKSLDSKLQQIIYNQRQLDAKLDMIIRKLR